MADKNRFSGLTDLVTINGGGHLVQGPQKPRLHQLCNTNQRISSATAIRESDQLQHQTKEDWATSSQMVCNFQHVHHSDKKENTIFLIYKEIQMVLGAKLYMRKGFLSTYMRKCTNIYMRRPLVIYDFAPDLIWISLYMRKIVFSFLSVH